MRTKYRIVCLPGDGIGPEVCAEAVRILEIVAAKRGIVFSFEYGLIGGAAIDRYGNPFPEQTEGLCGQSDAVLLGAVGGTKWENLRGSSRPEAGLLRLRAALGLYANLRPCMVFPALRELSPLKRAARHDLLIVRELTGGIYFGERGRGGTGNDSFAFDTEIYTKTEIVRIAETAFRLARGRRKKIVSVDKANVLESSRLWRETVEAVGQNFPDVHLEHMYVDNASMQIVYHPDQFDVLLTSNLFGDILSDEASAVSGSIGLLPSASLGAGTFGLYEPVHGSAPSLAGQNSANPIAAILSCALLLRYSFHMQQEADAVENAVNKALYLSRTADIADETFSPVRTEEMGAQIAEELFRFL